MKDYRKLIKKHYGIEFNDEYDVHHIDLNRKNNNINNLMILPKCLHYRYHVLLNATSYKGDIFQKTFTAKIHSNRLNSDNYSLAMAKQMIEVLEECNKWYDYKLYLDGVIPNIHKIKLEV